MKDITVCRLCSSCCPVEVEIENQRIISVKRIQRYSEPIHQICPKAQAAPEIIYSSKRLKTPRIKTDQGKWKMVSWETALDTLVLKMSKLKDRYGPESVCWLRGQASDWGEPWHYAMRMMHAFGSPNVIGNGSVCHAAREALQTFTYGDMTSPDYPNLRCIMNWGRNDQDTNPSAYEDLLCARRRGAKLIVIDPIQTDIAAQADLWLQIRPGTDGFLAMAMIHWMIKNQRYDRDFVSHWTIGFDRLEEEAEKYSLESVSRIVQIPVEKMIEAIQLYTNHQPACIAEGNGLDMHPQVSQATRTIAILRAISGNLDRMGGDLLPQPVRITNDPLRKSFFEKPIPISKDYPLFSQYSERRGIHTLGVLIDSMLEQKPYSIKGLIVQGANPLVTMANIHRVEEAFRQLEFLVVIDPMLTMTAKFADILLPASFSFEQTMLSNHALSGNFIQLQRKVIEPWGKSLPDWEIIFRIARKLGLEKEFPWKTVEDAIDDQLQPSGITVKDLMEHPEGILLAETRYQKYLKEGFKTPSHKVEIESSLLKKYGYSPIPRFWEETPDHQPTFFEQKTDYPFTGFSGRRPNYFVHSQFRHIRSLRKKERMPIVDIHPQDAAKNNICQGDWVMISTPNGNIEMKVAMNGSIMPGTIRIPWGWGENQARYNLNRLTDDQRKDPITSTTFNRLFQCRIIKR